MRQSMFERYGGFSSVSKVVSEFYDRVLDSPRLGPYFANIDMKQQISHQTKFIATLMGGPASYSDQELERKHAHLNVDEESFMEVATLLVETLEDFDFKTQDIRTLEAEFMRRKRYVVRNGAGR